LKSKTIKGAYSIGQRKCIKLASEERKRLEVLIRKNELPKIKEKEKSEEVDYLRERKCKIKLKF
jgi:hypothetical protein